MSYPHFTDTEAGLTGGQSELPEAARRVTAGIGSQTQGPVVLGPQVLNVVLKRFQPLFHASRYNGSMGCALTRLRFSLFRLNVCRRLLCCQMPERDKVNGDAHLGGEQMPDPWNLAIDTFSV